MKKISKYEEILNSLLIKLFSIKPEREYRFDSPSPGDRPRRWRFDFAYPVQKIAFEVEGGIWNGGRHVHPIGFMSDCEKYNAATKQGWKVYRLVPKFITQDYLESLIID